MLLTAINCYNVKSATLVQGIFTVTKVLALVVIILSGIAWLGLGNHKYLTVNPMDNTDWSPGRLSLAFYSGTVGPNFLKILLFKMLKF